MPTAARPTTPAAVLAALLRADATAPRLTTYDDTDGPGGGERVELSARVLANWVAKAGNALQDELDVGAGDTVLLALPPHWRAVYWALAAWSVGAVVELPDGDPVAASGAADGVVVSDDVDVVAAAPGPAVLVSLPMLSRAHPGAPVGAMDEARELATYGDLLTPLDDLGPHDEALVRGATRLTAEQVARSRPEWGETPRVLLRGTDLADVLADAVAAWAAGGSVVLVRGGAADQSARAQVERVTVDARRG
ncbi:TIGR03089 family protein [Lapillicoccus jejuensis]|uniref:Uncharacterized protein (TIGR03089 family) n=1 Tax=Lapillicoccus jejuensis TaxID=402171 RepID=A0A542E2F7_9MICO|nr:TIGR03089 family protein [Lapillicoccus jejuensis]TQJ09518.1 uncharacterized protein (TIGR03089 family) [Lapillicoccus jejuensis]